MYEEIRMEWVWAIKEWINEMGKKGRERMLRGMYDEDIIL